MRLESYLTEGSDTSSATNMELAIVQTWNGEKLKHPELGETAEKVVAYLKNLNIFKKSGAAQHLGSGSYGITDDWKRYGATDGTPKTDLIINGRRISLKKMGPSQLMSGKRGETSATFHTVANNMTTRHDDLIKQMESYLDKMITSAKSPMTITAQKKTGETAIDFKEAERMHKQFQYALSEVFKNSTEFKNGVVREAMTGQHKFGKGEPIADYLLVFGASGVGNKFHATKDENYIATIANTTKIEVSWKSISRKVKTESGKEYTFFSVLRLAQKHTANEMKKLDGKVLTEGMMSNLWTRLKNWFAALWKNIKNWLMKSVDNIMIFLGLDAEVQMGASKL